MIREGQLGTAFYFVATGEVRVIARAGNNKASSAAACMKGRCSARWRW